MTALQVYPSCVGRVRRYGGKNVPYGVAADMTEAEEHLSQSRASLAAVRAMEAALGRGDTDMTRHFTPDFLWRGNRGCGTKRGLEEFFAATGSARCARPSPTGSTRPNR